MADLHFKGKIEINGINPYVLVSKDRAQKLQLGWKKPMPVLIQINGKPEKPWKINMMPIGDGSFYLYLHEYVRKESNTKVGDIVIVDIKFDEKYKNGPMHPMPVWLKKELDANPKAKTAWKELTPSRQKEILRYLANLKSEEAKQRNLEKVIHVLTGNSARFMARDWKDGK